jgi:gliding motility-associated-like protein
MVNCWDTFVFNTTTCEWDNTGTQDDEPAMVNCWDTFVFNTTTCEWDNTGTQDDEPAMVNCWDTFVFNTTTCEWDNTGTQDDEPAMVNCWDTFVFNTTTCEWDNTGTQDDEPAMVNCWDTFVFNTTTCEWDNTGTQPTEPEIIACYQTATFNSGTCGWDVTGDPPVEEVDDVLLLCDNALDDINFITDGLATEINNLVLGGTWTDIDNSGGLSGDLFDPSGKLGNYEFTYKEPGDCGRTITLIVDVDACTVLPCSTEDNIEISKVVTANNDGVNDFFSISEIAECGFTGDVSIFNRWGKRVYYSKNYQNNWGGYHDGSGPTMGSNNKLTKGTYYYVVKIVGSGYKPITGYIYLGTN